MRKEGATLESIGAAVSENLYWIKYALIEATFQWRKKNDPQGLAKTPFDAVDAALPDTGPFVDACGYYERTKRNITQGCVPSGGMPYFWLGDDAYRACSGSLISRQVKARQERIYNRLLAKEQRKHS